MTVACGSSGQALGAFASGGLREPTAETIHFFVDARIDVRGDREVPSCYPREPQRHNYGLLGGLTSGIDVGSGATRVRIQVRGRAGSPLMRLRSLQWVSASRSSSAWFRRRAAVTANAAARNHVGRMRGHIA